MINDLSSKLTEYITPAALELIDTAASYADKNNINLFLVGGIVRDLILQRKSLDIDIVIEGSALQLASELSEKAGVKIVSHSKFGTAKITAGDFTIDIASARRELYTRPGALPTVFNSSVAEDLFRRDFTINAMALQLNRISYGLIIDPYNGMDDIKNKFIRIIHSNSFIDDATRIFRAIRYEQRLKFRIESKTMHSLKNNIDMIDTISPDRIKHELNLFLSEEKPEYIILRANELKIFDKVSPLLQINNKIAGYFKKARQYATGNLLLNIYYCLLTYHLDENKLSEFISLYNFPKQLRENMRQTQKLKSIIVSSAFHTDNRIEIYKTLQAFDNAAIYANIITCESGDIIKSLVFYISKLKKLRSHLSGKDLINLGVRDGPEIGIFMEKLMEARLNGKIKTKRDEEYYILNLIH